MGKTFDWRFLASYFEKISNAFNACVNVENVENEISEISGKFWTTIAKKRYETNNGWIGSNRWMKNFPSVQSKKEVEEERSFWEREREREWKEGREKDKEKEVEQFR